MVREKTIILGARLVSMLFTPFYLPILGLAALFFLSYLRQYPLSYKFFVLAVVYFFTILLPSLLIHLYRRYQGWSLIELGNKERRVVPYLISILCYFTCLYLMEEMHIPYFMRRMVAAALIISLFKGNISFSEAFDLPLPWFLATVGSMVSYISLETNTGFRFFRKREV